MNEEHNTKFDDWLDRMTKQWEKIKPTRKAERSKRNKADWAAGRRERWQKKQKENK